MISWILAGVYLGLIEPSEVQPLHCSELQLGPGRHAEVAANDTCDHKDNLYRRLICGWHMYTPGE